MKIDFYKPLRISDLIEWIKTREDRKSDYYVYSRATDSAEVSLNSTCYVGAPVDFNEEDEEVYPDFVTNNHLSLLWRDELIQDVMDHLTSQVSNPTSDLLLEAIQYYSRNDDFMDPG